MTAVLMTAEERAERRDPLDARLHIFDTRQIFPHSLFSRCCALRCRVCDVVRQVNSQKHSCAPEPLKQKRPPRVPGKRKIQETITEMQEEDHQIVGLERSVELRTKELVRVMEEVKTYHDKNVHVPQLEDRLQYLKQYIGRIMDNDEVDPRNEWCIKAHELLA